MNRSRNPKILSDKTIAVTVIAIRVPIVGGHSEAVNESWKNDFINGARNIWQPYTWRCSSRNTDTYTYPAYLCKKTKCL
jgi:aspartate-semialdehyde dehydrogenase